MPTKTDELVDLQAQATELGVPTHEAVYDDLDDCNVPLSEISAFFARYSDRPNAKFECNNCGYDGYICRIWYDQPKSAAKLKKEIQTKLRQLQKEEKARAKQEGKVREAELRELARLKEKYEGDSRQ